MSVGATETGETGEAAEAAEAATSPATTTTPSTAPAATLPTTDPAADWAGIDQARQHRGRVVMLIDNGVVGDSRVQKAAQSAAEAGWQVVLIGRSPDGRPDQWMLGGAEVRLVPVPMPLARRPYQFRRNRLRRLGAYPPNGVADHRQHRVRAWRADLRIREALLAMSNPDARRGRRLLARAALRAEVLAARLVGRWVTLRTEQLRRVVRAPRQRDNLLDRLVGWFWLLVLRERAWRRLEPALWGYELAYGRLIDELQPDLIHANDHRMLGVGARAKIRAQAAGGQVKLVWDAHEFLPGIKPLRPTRRWMAAQLGYEKEFAPYADAVITVSEGLADLLRKEHGLAERPTVVLNAPADDQAPPEAGAVPDLRALCGLGPDVPLLVYTGGVAPVRGVDIMIEALPELPDVHVALVVNRPAGQYMDGLLARAAKLGARGRVHPLPYVPYWQVVRFVSTADAGVHPMHHWLNHEIALPNKYFEYAQARLPIIVSDVRAMAEMTRKLGNGEVFQAQDIEDYIRAVRAVLADPARYRAAYDRPGLLAGWTWRAQAKVLDEVYTRALAGTSGGVTSGGQLTTAASTVSSTAARSCGSVHEPSR